MFRDKMKLALRDLVESAGVEGAVDIIKECLEEGSLKPEDMSIKEIWKACEGDKEVTEAVTTSGFPKITGELINKKVIEAYDAIETIGDQLTTTVPSNMEIDQVAGFTAADTPDQVSQGAPYQDSSIGEKYVTIPHAKYGKLISVTEEMIYFDKTGQILTRAAKIGQKAALYKEKLILQGVQDVNSNVYRPAGTPMSFYRAAAANDAAGDSHKINLVASNGFGESGLDAAYNIMHDMTDENGDPVMINSANLTGLFPFDLRTQVLQMVKSILIPEGQENAVNIYKGAFNPLFSPYISEQSTSDWFLGDFKEDFWWSEIWPLQTFTEKPGNPGEFERDIKSRHKVRFFGQIGAVDDKHCFKFTA